MPNYESINVIRQSLLWKLDFNRFLTVTFISSLLTPLEGFAFKRICLNFPLKIQFANTPATEFSVCTVTGALLCMQQSPSSQVCPWQRGHNTASMWRIPAAQKGVQELTPLFSKSGWKSTWSEFWILDQHSNHWSIGSERWISRVNLDHKFNERNLSRKYKCFLDS